MRIDCLAKTFVGILGLAVGFGPGQLSVAAPQATLVQQYADPAVQDAGEFGAAVAGHGAQPLVGAPGTTPGGVAYLYDSGSTAVPVRTFLPPATFAANDFGRQVASDGTSILVSDPSALPLTGAGPVTTGPVEATPDDFRGVVVHYASPLDVSPRILINPLTGGQTGFGRALAFGQPGVLAVGDPFITTASLPQNGRVYLYNGSSTSPTQELDNPTPGSQARFGQSLAYYSDTPDINAIPGSETSYQGAIVVGAPGIEAVHQFHGSTGEFLTTIPSPDPSHGAFGRAVATVGTRVIVGAPEASNLNGKVYIFDRTVTGTVQRTILNPNSADNRLFGISLAVVNNIYLAVGSEPKGTAAPKIRVFNILTGAVVAELTSPHTGRTLYGAAVAAAGANIAVGDPLGAKDAPSGIPGRAYLFSLVGSSDVPPDAPLNLTAIGVSTSSIFLTFDDNSLNETGFTLERRQGSVGAYSPVATLPANSTSHTDTGLLPGTLYFYRLRAFNNAGVSGYSNEASATTDKELPPDLVDEIPNPGGPDDRFGFAIARLGKSRLLIGAPGVDVSATSGVGRVYVYTPPALAPSMVLQNPNPQANGQFGFSVGAVGENILVGAPGDEDSADGGRAYLFSGETGQVIATYQDPSGLPGKQFGYSVGNNGKKQAIIGAPGAGPLDLLPGSAHLFDAKKTFIHVRSFDSSTSAAGDRFGSSVAAAKNRASIVTPNPEGVTCTNGRVEVFSLKKGTLDGVFDRAARVTEAAGKILVGAPGNTCAPADADFAYLLSGAALQRVYEPGVVSSYPTAFGTGLAGGKKFNAIGSPLYDDSISGTTDSGIAFLYSKKKNVTAPVRTYASPSEDTGDQFGSAMGFAGKQYLAIGAPYDDNAGADAGAVYLYLAPKK